VSRFVGEQGPVQIGSRANPEPVWEPLPPELSEDDSASPIDELVAPHHRRDRSRGHSRSRRGGGTQVALSVLLAAIIVASAIAVVMHVRGSAKASGGKAVGVAASVSPQHGAGKSTASSRESAPEVHHAAAPPAEAQAPINDGDRRPAAWTTRERGPYTLDVGGAPELESAVNARHRMQQLTGFEGWVASGFEDGAKPYRVLVGVYRSRERAQSVADMLVNNRTVANVTVVPLPPKSVRL
jgi:hypothetical protein